MISEVQPSATLNIAIGQYVTAKKAFVSDTMLTGDLLNFNPGTYYSSDEEVSENAFQVIYPASPGLYEMDKINCKNYKAEINVIDAYNFEIIYKFFCTKYFSGYFPNSNYSNSEAFLGDDDHGNMGFNIQVNDVRVVGIIPYSVYPFCRMEPVEHAFYVNNVVQSGYTAGQDLTIEIIKPDNTDNNFFVGLINESAINNADDIVPGLVSSYARINSSAVQVDDLPFSAFVGGEGFNHFPDGSYRGTVIVDGALLNGGNFKVYYVYKTSGGWQSCITDTISQSESSSFNVGAEYTVEDKLGNTSNDGCITGLLPGQKLTLKSRLDVAGFNAQLSAQGFTGTASDYLLSIVFKYGTNVLQITGDINEAIIEDFAYTSDIKPYFLYLFRLPNGNREVFKVYFDLKYNGKRSKRQLRVIDADTNEEVDEMCLGGNYINEDFAASGAYCDLYYKNTGSYFSPYDDYVPDSTALKNGVINTSSYGLVNGTAQVKKICTAGITSIGNPNCNPCGDIIFNSRFLWNGDYQEDKIMTFLSSENFDSISIIIDGTEHISLPIEVQSEAFRVTQIRLERGNCVWEWTGLFRWRENMSSAEATIDFNEEVDLSGYGYQECPEEEGNYGENPIAPNTAALDYTCNEEGDITLSLVKTFEDTPASERYEISLDGGVTFIPAPSSITGETSVHVIYSAIFDDSDNIGFHQNISCIPQIECNNNREIEISVDADDKLQITFNDNFESPVVSDIINISIDAGLTWLDPIDNLNDGYTPINIVGEKSIIVEVKTNFSDECGEIIKTETLQTLQDDTSAECEGYDGYSLDLNNNNGVFTVSTVGDENALEISEIAWTNNGANPFDANGSGLPYIGNIETTGLVIAAWKIKKEGCPIEILYDNEYQQEPPKVIINESEGLNFRQVISNETGNTFALVSAGNSTDPDTPPGALAASRNYDNIIVYRNNMILVGGDTSYEGYTIDGNSNIVLHNEVPLKTNETLIIQWL